MRVTMPASLLFSVLASAAAAGGPGLPKAGNCTYSHPIPKVVSWQGDTALIQEGDQDMEGEAFGLRRFDHGFKVSIRYRDPYVGKTEIVISRRDISAMDPEIARTDVEMSLTSFTDLPDGDRAIESSSGFSTEECWLFF